MYNFKMQTWQKKKILTTSESKSAAAFSLTELELAGPAGLVPAESGDINAVGTPCFFGTT